MDRTDRLLAFLEETEKLKRVYRQNFLADRSRQESTAEHSWHLAVMLLLFERDLPPGFDMLKAVKLALIHDIVEIDAGDVMFFDDEARKGKAERERKAAKRLFGLLPPDREREFAALFKEFEEKDSVEAKFVDGFDKLHPMAMNLASDGASWAKHAITVARLDRKKRPLMEGSPLLLGLYESLFAAAKERKLLG